MTCRSVFSRSRRRYRGGGVRRPAGLLFNGDRRYQIVVRVPDAQRNNIEALGALPIMLPWTNGSARGSVPLRQVASFGFSEGLNEISRDNGKRRIFVEVVTGAVNPRIDGEAGAGEDKGAVEAPGLFN